MVVLLVNVCHLTIYHHTSYNLMSYWNCPRFFPWSIYRHLEITWERPTDGQTRYLIELRIQHPGAAVPELLKHLEDEVIESKMKLSKGRDLGQKLPVANFVFSFSSIPD